MADEYTPTTKTVREIYIEARWQYNYGDEDGYADEFDRWLDGILRADREDRGLGHL